MRHEMNGQIHILIISHIFHIDPKAITRINRNQTLRYDQQKHKCLRTTTQSFCESILSTNFVTNKEKLLYLKDDKLSNGWLGHYKNDDSGEKTVIPLKLMISDIKWPSMGSQMCNNSDKTFETNKERSTQRSLILLAECEF